jgi:uncharacterized protein involved in exopolysaccharide biosynthesis
MRIDVLPVFTELLRFRRTLVTVVALFGVIGVVHAMLTPKRFTAGATFIVASSRGVGGLGGLAALASRIGARIPPQFQEESPYLYLSTIQTREVLDTVLLTPLALTSSPLHPVPVSAPDRVSLLDWYEIDQDADLPTRLEKGRRALGKRLDISLDEASGIITLKVRDRDPHVAAAIAMSVLRTLNDFTVTVQRTTSGATRRFLEDRLASVTQDLEVAERELRDFLAENRSYSESPTLQLEAARLQRRIDIVQQRYLDLSSELEQARSTEVQDTPVLTVLQQPAAPVRRSWPRRKLMLAGWLVAGGLVALIVVGLRAALAQYSSEGSTTWLALRAELDSARRRPFAPYRR